MIDFQTCFPTATGRLDFGASTDANVTWNNLFSDPNFGITVFGAGVYTYPMPITNLGDIINLFYWSSAYTQVNPGDAPAGSNFALSTQHFNSFVLETVGLRRQQQSDPAVGDVGRQTRAAGRRSGAARFSRAPG